MADLDMPMPMAKHGQEATEEIDPAGVVPPEMFDFAQTVNLADLLGDKESAKNVNLIDAYRSKSQTFNYEHSPLLYTNMKSYMPYNGQASSCTSPSSSKLRVSTRNKASFGDLDSSFSNLTVQYPQILQSSTNCFPGNRSLRLSSCSDHDLAVAPPSTGIQQTSVFDLYRKIFLLAKDFKTTFKLQKVMEELKLYNNDQEQWDLIYRAILFYLSEVAVDYCAWRLLKKMLSLCDFRELAEVVREISRWSTDVVDNVVKNQFGKLILGELVIKIKQYEYLVMLFINSITRPDCNILNNVNGISLARHCFSNLDDTPSLESLYAMIEANITKLAFRRTDYTLILAAIAKSKGHRNSLMFLIANLSLSLSIHEFGNYIIQDGINYGDINCLNMICERMRDHYVKLSMDKHGSNVMERLLFTPKADEVIAQLIRLNCLGLLAQDQYGNYVVQKVFKAIHEGNWELGQRVLKEVESIVNKISYTSYGNRVCKKMLKLKERAKEGGWRL